MPKANTPTIASQPLPKFGKETNRHAMRDRDANAVVDRVNALVNLRVVQGSKNELIVGETESVLVINLDEVAASSGTSSVSTYRVVSVQSDHYVCHTWDESTLTEGSEDVLVARPWEHRNSVGSEEIDGITYIYSYLSTTRRESDDGSTTEVQNIVPHIILHNDGDNPTVICAIQCNTGLSVGGSDVTLLDINVAGRAWSEIP